MNRRHFLATAAATGFAYSLPAAEADRKWRIGVIGHGGRGDYGHGLDTMWLQLPETEIVGVADATPASLEKAKARLNNPPAFADYRKMLAEVKPDIVAIGPRQIDQHLDMCLAVIASGARGIYMEKPFCRTLDEADQIIEAAKAKGTKVALAHRNRYHPVLGTIDRLIKEDTIGQVLEIRARGKEDQRGGALDLWVLGTHLLNLIHYFGGPLKTCSGVLLKDGKLVTKEDLAPGGEGVGLIGGNEMHARFTTERGITAYLDSIAKAGVPKAGFGLQVIGNKGLIDIRIDTEPLAHLVPGNPFQPTKEARPWIPISTAGPGQPEPIPNLGKQVGGHLLGGKDLIAAIRENRAPLCSAEDARVTIEGVMAVFDSHRTNGAVVELPILEKTNPLDLL